MNVQQPSRSSSSSSSRTTTRGSAPAKKPAPKPQSRPAASKDGVKLQKKDPAPPNNSASHVSAMARNFSYQPANLKDHTGANFWRADQGANGPQSGTDANRQINQDYANLSKAADQYMRAGTGAPTLNNFFEYAEQASTAVGEQVRNLENIQRAAGGSAESAVQAGRSMLNGQAVDQVRRVHDATMTDQANQVVRQHPDSNALLNGSRVAGGTMGQMWGELDTTRDALVNGNTRIHKELGEAANTFFKGEADGGKGFEALKKAGIEPGSAKDPDGLVTRAFSSMQKVRELSQKWEQAKTPEEKKAIEAERLAAAKDSTFSFMMQEQGHILQNGAIFDDKTMKRNLQAITPTMNFRDTNGVHGQLGEGKDYSNFNQRLGVNPVAPGTPGAFPLTKEGKTTHYLPDPSQKGSIVDYFSSNMEAARARPMIDAGPRNLEAPPATQAGRGALQLAQGVDRRDFSTMAAGGIRGAGGLASEGTQWAGRQAEDAGMGLALDGVRQAQQGGIYNTAMGNTKAVGGVVLHEGGKMAQAAGRAGARAVDWAADAADTSINWTANAAKATAGWAGDRVSDVGSFARWALGW